MIQSVPYEKTGIVCPPPPQPLRALLLDDSSFDRARIRRLSLKVDMAVQLDEVASITEMDCAVRESHYDLIMIDYRLPIGDGMEALDHILQDPRHRDAGKIMITGDTALDTAVRAMRAGCHDFLCKEGMSAELLSQAMVNAMTLARQRQEMRSGDHRDVIRQGLIAALSDHEVRGNIQSLLRAELALARPTLSPFAFALDTGNMDAFLASFQQADEFIFH